MSSIRRLRAVVRKVKDGRGAGGRPETHGARAVLERARDRLLDRRFIGARLVADNLTGLAADFGGKEQIGEAAFTVLETASYQRLARDLWWTWAVRQHAERGEWPQPPKWLYTNDASLTRNLLAAHELETARRSNAGRDGATACARCGSYFTSLDTYLEHSRFCTAGDQPPTRSVAERDRDVPPPTPADNSAAGAQPDDADADQGDASDTIDADADTRSGDGAEAATEAPAQPDDASPHPATGDDQAGDENGEQ